MKTKDKIALKLILALAMLIALPATAGPIAQATADEASKTNASVAEEWSVQVDRVVVGDEVTMEPAFQMAIYENLVDELARIHRFETVFRSGDHNASKAPDMLVLKTTILRYAPGSQTRRAVTTVSGATKIRVRLQLCTRGGDVVSERVINGNVRFFGTNFRATQNLARNVANAIKQVSLPAAGQEVSGF